MATTRTDKLIRPPTSQPVNQSTSQPVNQSISQPVNHSIRRTTQMRAVQWGRMGVARFLLEHAGADPSIGMRWGATLVHQVLCLRSGGLEDQEWGKV